MPPRRPSASVADAPGTLVIVEAIEPAVAGGFPAKAIVGDQITVSADVFTHGHDLVRAWLRHRPIGGRRWVHVPMSALGNDRFSGSFTPGRAGLHEVEVIGAPDDIASWLRDAERRHAAGRDDPLDMEVGRELLARAASEVSAAKGDGGKVADAADRVGRAVDSASLALVASLSGELARRLPPADQTATVGGRILVTAARQRAGFSTWYELFPRSASPDPGRPGTLTDVVARIPYVVELGFDVLYLPPVHPIGRTARKGKGNSTVASRGDVGSPWAIGSAEGGHTAIAPELGTIEDFDKLVAAANDGGIEIAMDLAFQCSPDHPWVTEHPDWFEHRADGTIACAENPPKRYEDIFPLDFRSTDAEALWEALLAVARFWVSHGVRIFRVDNPHTKPFAFWQWMIAEIKATHPEVIFLSEAFTRPKVMHRLAKLGFDQSYTYFTWRNTKWELTDYFTELTEGPGRTYFRPNVWPNTPDILAASLREGGRPAFVTRLVMAAGMSASYGIYGPMFELLVTEPAEPGSEEYFASEKYEVRHHDLDDPKSIKALVSAVNAARRRHPCLQRNEGLRFHRVDNEAILCWSKTHGGDAVVGIVNLDPRWAQSGFVELDLAAIGLRPDRGFTLTDVLDGVTYTWTGERNYVRLDPAERPAHLFEVEPEEAAR